MAHPIVQKLKNIDRLFLLVVVTPVLLAVLYFGIFASDVYVSESEFVVRAPDKPAPSGIGLVLAGAGFSNAAAESFTASSFVQSRDALKALNANSSYEKAFSSPHIWWAERFNGFGWGGSFESLYKYYLGRVKVENDVTTSISKLTVRAYTSDDAVKFNERLLQMAEQTVNQMNERGRGDMIRFANVEVDDAKEKARQAAVSLASYRNREGVIDPEVQATAQLEMISKLQDEMISTRAQLNQLRAFTPQNPQIPFLNNRLETLQREIKVQMGTLAGGSRSLAASAVQYQRLFLENEFAGKQLASALASLQEARNEARRQQVYVERIVQPNKPDTAIEPRRWRGILATLALSLVAWGILSMLSAGIREHAQ